MEQEMAETINSYSDFLTERGITNTPEAMSEFSIVLTSFRERRARELGITLEELHAMRFEHSKPTSN